MVAADGDIGVVVLYNQSAFVSQGEPQDLIAVQGVIDCARAVAEALGAAGRRVAQVPVQSTAEEALWPYPPHQWVVFNLCEALNNRLFEEARTAWALEALGYRFTGNSGAALARSTHKAQAKALLERAGIPTPEGHLYSHPEQVSPNGLVWPLIVKPVAEDASQGIGGESVVSDLAALRQRVGYIHARYRQAALAERFIAGREFNVSLWGQGEPLPLAEIDFAQDDPLRQIVSYAAKWQEDSPEYRGTPVRCPAEVEPEIAERIRQVARQSWEAIGCRGYARVDIRLETATCIPYVVEVNCNPDISPDAGFFRAARAAGYDFRQMVERILEDALQPDEQPGQAMSKRQN